MFLLNSLTTEGVKNRAVPVLDLFLAQEAAASSKTVGAIENATEQCNPLNMLNESHVNFQTDKYIGSTFFNCDLQVIQILNETLSKNDSVRWGALDNAQEKLSIKNLIEHYNCGSLDERIFERDSIQVRFEKYYQVRKISGKQKIVSNKFYKNIIIKVYIIGIDFLMRNKGFV